MSLYLCELYVVLRKLLTSGQSCRPLVDSGQKSSQMWIFYLKNNNKQTKRSREKQLYLNRVEKMHLNFDKSVEIHRSGMSIGVNWKTAIDCQCWIYLQRFYVRFLLSLGATQSNGQCPLQSSSVSIAFAFEIHNKNKHKKCFRFVYFARRKSGFCFQLQWKRISMCKLKVTEGAKPILNFTHTASLAFVLMYNVTDCGSVQFKWKWFKSIANIKHHYQRLLVSSVRLFSILREIGPSHFICNWIYVLDVDASSLCPRAAQPQQVTLKCDSPFGDDGVEYDIKIVTVAYGDRHERKRLWVRK